MHIHNVLFSLYFSSQTLFFPILNTKNLPSDFSFPWIRVLILYCLVHNYGITISIVWTAYSRIAMLISNTMETWEFPINQLGKAPHRNLDRAAERHLLNPFSCATWPLKLSLPQLFRVGQAGNHTFGRNFGSLQIWLLAYFQKSKATILFTTPKRARTHTHTDT